MCNLCNISTRKISQRNEFVVFESSSSIAVPTLGALTKGWCILFPKRHYESCLDISQTNLEILFHDLSRCLDILTKIYSHYSLFFHISALSGASINHFHIHLVPNVQSKILDRLGEKTTTFHLKDINTVLRTTKYALISGEGYSPHLLTAHILDSKPESQIIRKEIANYLMIPHWDWKDHPYKHNTYLFINQYKKACHGYSYY